MNPILDESAFAAALTFCRVRDGVSWSVGVPGVVAEFHAPPGSGINWSDTRRDMTASCEGGAMTIRLRDGVMTVPYDLESRRHGHRVRGVLFCLSAAEAPLASSAVLREVGERDGAVLFDIGAGAPSIEPMVMVSDPSLITTLRNALGDVLVGTHHPALVALVEASPPRLFRTGLAEITVTQPIARTETPEGPHTHLLPDLNDGSTHDPRIAVPEGWVPCLTLHVPDCDDAFSVTQPAGHQ
jgi:hypothetical protein